MLHGPVERTPQQRTFATQALMAGRSSRRANPSPPARSKSHRDGSRRRPHNTVHADVIYRDDKDVTRPGRSGEAFHPRELSAGTGSVGAAKLIPVFMGSGRGHGNRQCGPARARRSGVKQKTADIHGRRYKKRAAMTGRPPLYLRRSSRMRAIAIAICPTSKTKTIFMDESHLTARAPRACYGPRQVYLLNSCRCRPCLCGVALDFAPAKRGAL